MTTIISGISGQDGHFLAKVLLALGHNVVGWENLGSVSKSRYLHSNLAYQGVQLANSDSVKKEIRISDPSIFIHLAAYSFARPPKEHEHNLLDVNFLSVFHILNALRDHAPNCRFLLASSAEVFGSPDHSPQSESSALSPRTLYGTSKAAAQMLVAQYRRQYKMFACSAILFNHESVRRPPQFVTRKITQAAARIKLGLQDKIVLGNLESQRDWTAAEDVVEAMVKMTQAPVAKDYVIGSGRLHSVEQFGTIAFERLGLRFLDHVEVDPQFWQSKEEFPLCANASLIQRDLGWSPKISLNQMIETMVDYDYAEQLELKNKK